MPVFPIVMRVIRPSSIECPSAPQIMVVLEFMLGGEAFDVVCVHQTGEERVVGEEVIRRADTDGRVVRSDEDWQFVYEHRHELPTVLYDYWLVTAWSGAIKSAKVAYLIRVGSRAGWRKRFRDLNYNWGRRVLVLRRRTKPL